MATAYPAPLEKLVAELSRLPGIGQKTAQRLAFHILALPDEEAFSMADAIRSAKEELTYCSVCGNLTDTDPCAVCSDVLRDRSLYCVVESPRDVTSVERMKEYKGLYHVLGGALSPMSGIGPEELNVASLINEMIRRLNIPHESSPISPYVSVSIGAYIVQYSASNDMNRLYNKADEALYIAKKDGRNRAVINSDYKQSKIMRETA